MSVLSQKYFKRKKQCFQEMPDGRIKIDTSSAAGRKMRDEITARAWARDNGICGICGKYVCLLECVGEHIIPKGMGGSTRDDRLSNIQPAHWECNGRKGSIRDYSEAP